MLASPLQLVVARQSCLSGVLAIAVGMLYGTQIHDGTLGHPVLALAVHVQFITNGMLVLLGGILLSIPQACSINNRTALYSLQIAHTWASWIELFSEVWGAWYGVSWPGLLKKAELPACDANMFKIFQVTHFGPGFLLMGVWFYLAWAVYATRPTIYTSKNA